MEQFFNKITSDEYWNFNDDGILISDKEYSTISNMVKKEIPKFDVLDPLHCGLRKSNKLEKNAILITLRNKKFHANVITVFKVPDEYYLVRLSNSLGNGETFKCDQIDGLFKCIKHIMRTSLHFYMDELENLQSMKYLKLFESNIPKIILNNITDIQVRYINFDGHTKFGTIICNRKISEELKLIFNEIYDLKFPIYQINPIEKFNNDDMESVKSNNSSCFNYRKVIGSNNLSDHSTGNAIDINPMQNPWVHPSAHKIEGREYNINKVGTITKNIVDIFKKYGWGWGGEWRNPDYQHFFKPDNDLKNQILNEKNIKLFEAYSGDDYQKALFKVKDMIRGKKSTDDILAFVNKYASDDAKQIDQLRVMLDRIFKMYSNFSKYFFYNRKQKMVRKKGGEYENKDTYDVKLYFAFEKQDKEKIIDPFLQQEKRRYDIIIDSINTSIDLKVIKFVFEKLFELLEWVGETGVDKHTISQNRFVSGMTEEDIISKIESLNNLDFDNECEELKKLVGIGKIQIRKAINSID